MAKLDDPHDRGDFFKSLGMLVGGFMAERVEEAVTGAGPKLLRPPGRPGRVRFPAGLHPLRQVHPGLPPGLHLQGRAPGGPGGRARRSSSRGSCPASCAPPCPASPPAPRGPWSGPSARSAGQELEGPPAVQDGHRPGQAATCCLTYEREDAPGPGLPHLRGPLPLPRRGHPHGRARRRTASPTRRCVADSLHRLRALQLRLPHARAGHRGGACRQRIIVHRQLRPCHHGPPLHSEWDGPMKNEGIGISVARREGPAKLTGTARYVADQVPARGASTAPPCAPRWPTAGSCAIRFGEGMPWDEFTIVTAQDIEAMGWHNRVESIEPDQPFLARGLHQPRRGAHRAPGPSRTGTCWSGPGGR